MAELKPCRKCFEDGFLRPCFLWKIGMCDPIKNRDISAWNKRSK